MHLHAAVERFVVQLQADGRAPSTMEQYRMYLRVLGDWLAKAEVPLEVESITHEQLARFLASDAVRLRHDGQPRKATAANVLRSKVRTFFAYLADAGYIDRSPARLIRRARCAPPVPRSLSPEEQEKLHAHLGEKCSDTREVRDRALISLLLGTGLRIGSALALRVEDVDLAEGTAWIRTVKGGGHQEVFLDQCNLTILAAVIANRTSGPVFLGGMNRPLCARHARVRLAAVLRAAGIRRTVSPHGLRHAFARALYGKTGDVLLVQQALGHRSLNSTEIYARADGDRLRAALGN